MASGAEPPLRGGRRGAQEFLDPIPVGQERLEQIAYIGAAGGVRQPEVSQKSSQLVDRCVLQMAHHGAAQAQRTSDDESGSRVDRDPTVHRPGERAIGQRSQHRANDVTLGIGPSPVRVEQGGGRIDGRCRAECGQRMQQLVARERKLGDGTADGGRLNQTRREITQTTQRCAPERIRAEFEDGGQLVWSASGEPIAQVVPVRHVDHSTCPVIRRTTAPGLRQRRFCPDAQASISAADCS